MASGPIGLARKDAMLFNAACLALLALTPASDEPEFTRLTARRFEFPLFVQPDRLEEIRQINLFISWDRGKTWKKVASASASQKAIRYTAPRDGLAWFTLQVTYKDDRVEPARLGMEGYNIQKVLIDTGQGDPTKDPVKTAPEKPAKAK
jgi:hypothetical protein